MDAEDLNWRVEQACTNAYPSPRQVLLDGWLLRLSAGPVRRTSSVNPLRSARYDLSPVIDECAALYAALSLPLRFRVPTIAPGMAVALDRLNYPVRQEVRTLFAVPEVAAVR